MQDKVIGEKEEAKDQAGNVVQPARPGRKFRFDKLTVEEGLALLLKITTNFGSTLAGLQMAAMDNPGELGAKIIGNLTGRMSETDVQEIIKKLLSCVSCLDPSNVDVKGMPTGKIEMNRTFAGRYMEMFQVVVESFKYNFADFLGEISSILSPDLPSSKLSPSNPPTLTGGSGAP